MMFGYLIAIEISHISHVYVGGAINSFNIILPTITGFFLVICFIDSRHHLRLLIFLLVALSTFLAYEGCLQHNTGFSHGGLEPYYENKYLTDGENIKVPRIRWYGVFNDPNDLGLALVLVVPFLLNMLLQRHLVVPLMTLPFIGLSIFYTNSRGTALAGLVAIGTYFIVRYRSLYGVVAGGLLAVVLLFFGPSRMSSVSASEESAYGRIEAWYEAYQMFKASPLFGVGQGRFTEFHTLTAHNSFVLVMAELGIFGLFFFTGLFYFPYYWLWDNFVKKGGSNIDREDTGLVSASFASLTGMLASMFFISRSYILLPFILVALVTGITRVIDSEKQSVANDEDVKPKHFRNIFILTVLQIIGINIFVKLVI
ncbi:MAG: O-antigen ligase family protein [Desulfuromonadaceae bacterium]